MSVRIREGPSVEAAGCVVTPLVRETISRAGSFVVASAECVAVRVQGRGMDVALDMDGRPFTWPSANGTA